MLITIKKEINYQQLYNINNNNNNNNINHKNHKRSKVKNISKKIILI